MVIEFEDRVPKPPKDLFLIPPWELARFEELHKQKFIDPSVRSACDAINRSGWVWTWASCSGQLGEGQHNCGMAEIGLVCRVEDFGRAMEAVYLVFNAVRAAYYFVQPCDQPQHPEWRRFYFRINFNPFNPNEAMLVRNLMEEIGRKLEGIPS